MQFLPTEDIAAGRFEDLLTRLEAAAKLPPDAPSVAALLGAVNYPDYSLDEMALRMPVLKATIIAAKNARQRREWEGNFSRAAREFGSVIGKRSVLTVTEEDAGKYEKYYRKRAEKGEVTANFATKQLRYLKQMIDTHFDDISMPKSKRVNPFLGTRVSNDLRSQTGSDNKKLSFPESWLRDVIIRDRVLEELSCQASDIAIIATVTGCRHSEIYDLPAEDIHLDGPISYFEIRTVTSGSSKRQIKNKVSARRVVLLGPALDAMRRNPRGFDQYRGKANFSGPVNAFLRERGLFPQLPEGREGRFVISGTRHSFEDRMRAAKIGNEERAFLMGHSVAEVRGRPVYGSTLDLPVRALLQEMVAFPSETWMPRPIADLWAEIDVILREQGYRIE